MWKTKHTKILMVAIKFLMMLILFACIFNGMRVFDHSWFQYHFDTKPIKQQHIYKIRITNVRFSVS